MNLNPGEIHIWSTAIDERYEKLLKNSFLSVNEKKRAKKYSNDIDAFIFIVRHNLLRIILGKYLNCHPSNIKFNSNHYQKPHIAHPKTNIQFNISVSSNRFVAAFCLHHTLGIDIELIRPIENIDQLAFDYFTPAENEWLFNQSETTTEKVFFDIWSKKEAIIKAIGKGLNIKLNTFDVLSSQSITHADNQWNLIQISLFDDCASTLVSNTTFKSIIHKMVDDLI